MLDISAEDPGRARVDSGCISPGIGSQPMPLLDNYPWASEGTVVDVGGSHGAASQLA